MDNDDKIDLILLKIKEIDNKIDKISATVEAHRVEHGFQKMQDGGINANFQGGPPGGGGMGGAPQNMPGGGFPGGGMGGGYQMPGMGQPPGGSDPSRPPGM